MKSAVPEHDDKTVSEAIDYLLDAHEIGDVSATELYETREYEAQNRDRKSFRETLKTVDIVPQTSNVAGETFVVLTNVVEMELDRFLASDIDAGRATLVDF